MKNIIRNKCSICNEDIEKIYELENIPISLFCCDNIENYKYNNLSFSQCKQCNTMQLNNLIPLDILYENSHNFTSVGKLWENYFILIINKIKSNSNNKNVLEIGCPSGKIALNISNYKKWYIVDPNKNKSINFQEKICFIETFFDEKFSMNDNIDLIVHSHLFEHIYEPNKFLQKCYEILNENGEMIFGVPNMSYLAESESCLFLGIFFEHTIFLNKENIIFMLNKNNFEIVEIVDYLNHSTIYHVKKTQKKIYNDNFKITNYFNKFISSTNNYISFINNCNSVIANTSKNVYIFGASYNTQLILTMGIMTKYISGIIDNAEEKKHKYLYGFDLLIYSPDVLIDNDCIVILKNACYVNEISEQILKLNSNTEILV